MAQAAVKTTEPEIVEPARNPEIDPQNVQVDSAGQFWRNLMVRCPDGMVQDDLMSSKIWKKVQGNRTSSLIKLDRLFVLAFDESWYCEAVVSHATGADATLIIQKVGTFREQSTTLFSDGTYRVFWNGTAYGVERVSDGIRMGNQGFSTEGLAQDKIRGLYPKVVG